MQITNEGTTGVLKLNGKLNIWVIEQTKESIIRAFSGEGDILLDLSEVTACDVAGIQLLFSAVKTAENLERRLLFTRVSEAVKKTAVDGGFPSIEPHILAEMPAEAA